MSFNAAYYVLVGQCAFVSDVDGAWRQGLSPIQSTFYLETEDAGKRLIGERVAELVVFCNTAPWDVIATRPWPQ